MTENEKLAELLRTHYEEVNKLILSMNSKKDSVNAAAPKFNTAVENIIGIAIDFDDDAGTINYGEFKKLYYNEKIFTVPSITRVCKTFLDIEQEMGTDFDDAMIQINWVVISGNFTVDTGKIYLDHCADERMENIIIKLILSNPDLNDIFYDEDENCLEFAVII